MRMFDAEPAIIQDLKEESELQGEKAASTFTVVTARHPTLGKLVMIVARDGSGVVVVTEE
jgi:hypothetical protein